MERLGSQLPCLGPSFPVGRWGSNPHRTGGQMGGWRGKHMGPGTQQALAQRRSQRGPGLVSTTWVVRLDPRAGNPKDFAVWAQKARPRHGHCTV